MEFRNENDQVIMLNPHGDVFKFIREFKVAMCMHKCGQVLSGNQDHNLARPDGAFNRKNGLHGTGHFKSKHERIIADYLKLEKIRSDECVFILGS